MNTASGGSAKVEIVSGTYCVIGGVEVRIYAEICKTKQVNYTKLKRGQMRRVLIDKSVWMAIQSWIDAGGYGGLKLHEYLDKMFGV